MFAPSVCSLFKERARWTWKNVGSRLPDRLINEETATNENLYAIQSKARGLILAHRFSGWEEGRVTGADWEWFFVSGPQFLYCRVQAKIIDHRLRYSSVGKAVARGAGFPTGTRQVDLLIQDSLSVGAVPLYCFYNYWDPLAPIAPGWACPCVRRWKTLWGCAIVDAFTVRKLVASGATAATAFLPFAFPWHCLVCCTDADSGGVMGRGNAERARSFLAKRLPRVEPQRDERRQTELQPIDKLPRYVKGMMAGKRIWGESLDVPASFVMAMLDSPAAESLITGKPRRRF